MSRAGELLLYFGAVAPDSYRDFYFISYSAGLFHTGQSWSMVYR